MSVGSPSPLLPGWPTCLNINLCYTNTNTKEAGLVDGRCERGLAFSTPGWPPVFHQNLTWVLAQYTEVQYGGTLMCLDDIGVQVHFDAWRCIEEDKREEVSVLKT